MSVTMCGEHHHERHHEHHGGRGFGRGFRRGFPSREEWLERLQMHEQRLERDLSNVRELIERLGNGGGQPQPEI
ncbi:MAG TPA: hypothetical protein VGL84_06580 [Gaiellaceae bacterium]